jgi:hypothetical protein
MDQHLNLLLTNPEQFVNNLYTIKKTSVLFGKFEVSSPYIKINDAELSCIVDNTCNININRREVKQGMYRVNIQGEEKLFQIMKISPSIEISDTPYIKLEQLNQYKEDMALCLYGKISDNSKYIQSDEYTNNLLILSIIKYIYNQIPPSAGLKGIQFLDASSIIINSSILGLNLYQDDAVNIMEFMRDYRNFNHLENIDINNFGSQTTRIRVFSTVFIIDLFRQLLVNLQMLQSKYSFNHGNLMANKILIKNTPIQIAFNTIRHSSEITVMMSDFRYASMNIQTSNELLRIFNANQYAEKYFIVAPFKPVIDKSFDQAYYSLDEILSIQALAKIRHLGIPFYSSFDTITLVLSLLLIPEVYYRVFTHPELKRILWDSLWHPKDNSIIFDELTKLVMSDTEVNYDGIIKLLSGKWIKCNITDILLKELSYSIKI